MATPRPEHIVAPLALVAALVAVFLVARGTLDSGGSSTTAAKTSTTHPNSSGGSPKPGHKTTPRTYVVKPGDTLSNIGSSTGVTVERIQQLNPGVSATALRPGQKLKLAPAQP